MDHPFHFSEDDVEGLPPAKYQGRTVTPPFPTLRDWIIEIRARNDPSPREDLIHPFVD